MSFTISNENHALQAFRDYLEPPNNNDDDDAIRIKKTFREGQKESASLILDEIDRIQSSYVDRGMREWDFTFGFLNCLLIFYIFGAHPGHFWIIYGLESSYWLSYKLYQMIVAKPMCEIFYYLDFCWVMNFLILAFFVINILTTTTTGETMFSSTVRRELFLCAYGIAVGPVFMACMALPFVAFVFHDVNTMANLVSHLLPSMLMYIMKYQPESMQLAYPNLFHLEYVKENVEIPFFGSSESSNNGSIARNASIVYMAWFIPYLFWMCVIGLKLPVQYNYDTVFHSLWRGGPCELVGKHVWRNRSVAISRQQSQNDDFELRDLLLYMTLHLIVCITVGILGVAQLCHSGGRRAHFACLVFAVGICAKRGANRYAYYATSMYGNRIRKHLRTLLEEDDDEKSSSTKKEN